MQGTASDENDSGGANTDDGAAATAPADNPVNPTAPPAESDEDNLAIVSVCADRSAANPLEG